MQKEVGAAVRSAPYSYRLVNKDESENEEALITGGLSAICG
jgi:hypothetical protein